ncbi:MAG: hypothetical protein E7657_01980, partial [Ruminococcaceae bacterium]|nr:hypothetical protein [Oscillospiraceae bacterium]
MGEEIFRKAGVSRLLCGFDVQLLCGPQCFACALAADRLTDVDKLIEDLARKRRILGDELINKRLVSEQMLGRMRHQLVVENGVFVRFFCG